MSEPTQTIRIRMEYVKGRKCSCCKTEHVVETMPGVFWCSDCRWLEYEAALSKVHKHRLIEHVKQCPKTKLRVVPRA